MRNKVAKEIKKFIREQYPNISPENRNALYTRIKKEYKQTPWDKRNIVYVDGGR